MKSIKEIDKDFEYIATLGETMDSRDMSNQCLGYKTALKDILELIDELKWKHCPHIDDNCPRIDVDKLKQRIEGK